jgi:hypothetical protein
VIWSFVYLAVRKLLALVVLAGRSDRSKELEILVLRHELVLLRRQSGRLEVLAVLDDPDETRRGVFGLARRRIGSRPVSSLALAEPK